MPHSYVSSLHHCVFSTKDRRKIIPPDLADRLWRHAGGIACDNRMKALAVGGVEDHMHILLSLPSTLSIAQALQLIKGGTSRWIHDTFPTHGDFAWQEGYGAFSIRISQIEDTIAYIHSQPEHHHTKTFEDEFLAFLKKHGIEYAPRHVWG